MISLNRTQFHPGSGVVVLNLWIVTSLCVCGGGGAVKQLFHRDHISDIQNIRYLHYDSYQQQNYGYEVAIKCYGWGHHNTRTVCKASHVALGRLKAHPRSSELSFVHILKGCGSKTVSPFPHNDAKQLQLLANFCFKTSKKSPLNSVFYLTPALSQF